MKSQKLPIAYLNVFYKHADFNVEKNNFYCNVIKCTLPKSI